MYLLTDDNVKELAELIRSKLEDKGRKHGGLDYSKAGEAVYQMIKHHLPKVATHFEPAG